MKETKIGSLIVTIFLGMIAAYHLVVGTMYLIGPIETILNSKVFGIYVFMFGFMLVAMLVTYHVATKELKNLKSKERQPKREE